MSLLRDADYPPTESLPEADFFVPPNKSVCDSPLVESVLKSVAIFFVVAGVADLAFCHVETGR